MYSSCSPSFLVGSQNFFDRDAASHTACTLLHMRQYGSSMLSLYIGLNIGEGLAEGEGEGDIYRLHVTRPHPNQVLEANLSLLNLPINSSKPPDPQTSIHLDIDITNHQQWRLRADHCLRRSSAIWYCRRKCQVNKIRILINSKTPSQHD